jgi:hypothetical protein
MRITATPARPGALASAQMVSRWVMAGAFQLTASLPLMGRVAQPAIGRMSRVG